MDRPQRSLGALDSRRLDATGRPRPLLILPIGALEAHGPHLPLAADAIQAESTAGALADRVDALVAPVLPYGHCVHAKGFPGTISLSVRTLASLVEELLVDWAGQGFDRFLLLSGHAETLHMAALREGAERARAARPGIRGVVVSDYEFVYERRGLDAPSDDGHAGLLETSRMMALAPGLVGAERPIGRRAGSPHRIGPPAPEEWPESVSGDPRSASAELGMRLQAHVVERLTALVNAELGA